MKVLQFAFDENEDSPYLTHRYERNCIVYTGTHDNETTRGWFRNLSQHDRNFARAYIGCEGKHETAAVWSMIRAAMSSVADRCVIPVQDYLCLGNEARINEPSTLGDNWKWRMKKGQLNETIIQKIYKMTKLYGRLVKEETEEKEKTEADREKISDKYKDIRKDRNTSWKNRKEKIRKSCSRKLLRKRIPDREILPQEAVFCGSLQEAILCIQDIVFAPVS